ncbi:L-aspartate oxidase [Sporichthya sp.]|uniref:L-aspartate oxidase n=1 Tax=Sporichthya sp. TaxID=65475 RepID=UPI0017E69156|nr:L-aspartate oxidase [Sporichthya sp.]MBA3744000.1 L-aspartate oxidase [Sporichthya sp.]
MSGLPRRLAAPEPGWIQEADVVVVGSGIAGLTIALRAADLGRVLVITKDVLAAGSTQWAQGGIAAALGPEDSPAEHERDTLLAGDGLCDPDAVRLLVTEGPAAVRRLIAGGAVFDLGLDGELALGREGGHRRDRIAHAGGDATGAEIQRSLVDAVRLDSRIEVIEHALALDLLLAADGGVAGLTLHVMGEGQRDGVGAVHAPVVVLATGGLGQIYEATTNPLVSTGDGTAMALRAGAVVRDLEFVQFHPTVLWLGADSAGQQPLISEAVRGEGAVLVDSTGRPFMAGEHELGDLAPRSVVAKAILRRMRSTAVPHVWLDARSLGAATWEARFPTILAKCREHGIDPVTDLIPVVPACHYASGGVRTDLAGRSSLPGLYACGEAACSGVHGANRLASNSLLEGLVFAERIADDLHRTFQAGVPHRRESARDTRAAGVIAGDVRGDIQRLMSAGAGVLRNDRGLRETEDALIHLGRTTPGEPCVEAWETTNLLTVARVLVAAAGERAETRGSHWREDFPERDDTEWLGHLDCRLTGEGVSMVHTAGHPGVPSAVLAAELGEAGLPAAELLDLVARALAEDLAPGRADVTSTATVPAEQRSVADVVARADGVVAGLAVARAVFETVTRGAAIVDLLAKDGERVQRGDVLMSVSGRTRDLLVAERTALNFLCHLSGIATATRAWAEALAGTRARVRDTRKTTPGLRALEKYAVRAGGGVNHRMSLWDEALVKDNHVIAAGGVVEAFAAVRSRYPDLPVEVEVDSLTQLQLMLDAGADLVLLDNFTPDQMRAAVELTAGRARLEASGGLTFADAAAVAATGVDYVSVGALTHSAPILDIALDLREETG